MFPYRTHQKGLVREQTSGSRKDGVKSTSTLKLYEIADPYLQALEAFAKMEDLPRGGLRISSSNKLSGPGVTKVKNHYLVLRVQANPPRVAIEDEDPGVLQACGDRD